MEGKILRFVKISGLTVLVFFESFLKLRDVHKRRQDIIHQIYRSSLGTLFVTMIVALFIGMILSLQTGAQLEKFQQQESVGMIVVLSLITEMGPMMTAIILAATMGSAIAAELGTMSVSEEIDALTVMNISPISYLAMPRILALTLSAPILTVFTDIVGSFGGAFVANLQLNVSITTYFKQAIDSVATIDIVSGLIKASIFGAIIASIGCTLGITTRGGALGVGESTRRTVIFSFLSILICGYFMTWLFYRSGMFDFWK
jgi:phospholipid/cholesterol/gamma-HCH transport system permease protein